MSASNHLSTSQFAYQDGHRPPDPEYGASMHNPEMMYPGYHQMPHVYATRTNPQVDQESHRAMTTAHGNPDADIKIYRAGPKNEINPGDWVTPSRSYAQQHKESNGERGWTIASRTVKAKHLYSEGNSIAEWGYHPNGGE